MIKVAFNGTALMSPLTGIGQYARHLALGLMHDHDDLDLLFFYAHRFERQVGAGAVPMVGTLRALVRQWVPHSYAISRGLQQRNFDKGVRENKFDIYHEPNFLAFKFDGPSIITVHDLSWIRFPETHPAKRVAALHTYFEPGLRRASLVLTDSEFVKRELIEVFGIAADRIRAVPLGLDPVFRPMDAQQTLPVLTQHGLTHGQYFLSVGTMEPRKNIKTTVAAYSRLPEAVRQQHPLVMAGMKGWRTSPMEKVLAPLVASGQARMLGYLERSDLAAITAGALTMVYPSIYEGFGLPPLEAMGCGVPAIASNVSSLPEVVGDTGLSVDPLDVVGLTEAMHTMSESPVLRAQLSERALARAAGFTWEQCVTQTADSYRRVLSSSR